jgi:hypothetical protein
MELGDDARYVVKGEAIFMFHLESGDSLDSHDVIYVPGLKINFISVSAMEERGFDVTFQSGKVLIRPKKVISNDAIVIGVI